MFYFAARNLMHTSLSYFASGFDVEFTTYYVATSRKQLAMCAFVHKIFLEKAIKGHINFFRLLLVRLYRWNVSLSTLYMFFFSLT